MKKLKKLMMLSLFSAVLVQSCITVPRIDKKDSRNNLFSQELQNFMATKHPQKIDTVARKTSSDTITNEVDSNWFEIGGLGKVDQYFIDTTKFKLYLDAAKLAFSWAAYDTVRWKPLWFRTKHDTIIKHEIKIRTIAIHDTTYIVVVNNSQIFALETYLQASRDSTNQFILKYTEQKSTSRLRLIWIIGLGIVVAGLGYFSLRSLKLF